MADTSAATESNGITDNRELMWSAVHTTSNPAASARRMAVTNSVRLGVPPNEIPKRKGWRPITSPYAGVTAVTGGHPSNSHQDPTSTGTPTRLPYSVQEPS